jgi:putative aminopeptidase FrvX
MAARKKDKLSDTDRILAYLEKLVTTPSPTGFTGKVIDYLASNARSKGIDYEITRKGAMIYKFEKAGVSKKTMLAVHVDTLGAIVKKVEKDKVLFDLLGGYPLEYVTGNYCTIHTFDGKEIPGTILPKNPAVHVNAELKEKKFKVDDMVVRVDISLKNKNDSLEKYIEVGNFISLDPGYRVVNGFVKSRHLDDKASAAILLNIADTLVEKFNDRKFKPRSNFYFFFNITEESGQGIAGYPDIDDLLVVDMGAIGEGLSGDESSVSICAKDSTGPYNYEFTHELVKICKSRKIPYKMDIFPFYGSDGSGALRAGRDIRVALIGPGIGASHGYERTQVASLEAVNKLLREYLLK